MLAALACAGAALMPARAADTLPNFAPDSRTGWLAQDDEFIVPAAGAGPIRSDEGKTLEVNVHVEDPGAFTTPWDAIQRYRRIEQAPIQEIACAENNGDVFHQELDPMPQADKPDF